MPKGRPNKTHIAVHLRDRKGEALVPIQGIMLYKKCRDAPQPAGVLQPDCEWFAITLVNNTFWAITEEEYERLKPILT